MSVVVRFGVILIASLTLYVIFTIFRQLGEANQVFKDIVRKGIIASYGGAIHGDGEKQSSDAYNLKDYVGQRRGVRSAPQDPKRSLFKTARGDTAQEFPPINAKYSQQFRSDFQEKVYTIERRIFHSHKESTGRDTRIFRLAKGRRSTNAQRNKTSFLIQPASTIHSRGFEKDTNSSTSRDSSRARVIILAYRRSGSSFLGEMFNRNPEIFYLFEPVQPIEATTGRGRFPLLYDTLVRHLFDVIYTCSFVQHPFLVNFLSSSPFRLKSQILKSPSLCDADVTTAKMHRRCRPINAAMLTSLCSSRAHIVVKSIRTSGREILEFQDDPPRRDKKILASLKVVHLVRDPRAIVASRLMNNLRNLSSSWVWPRRSNSTRRIADAGNTSVEMRAIIRSVRVASSNLCSRMHSDMKHGGKLRAGRYAMVRYEDAAMRPLVAYDEIYAFVGIEPAREVAKWLRENTKSDLDPGYYSTSRNSSASARGWRSRLPFELAREVQKQCRPLMETLGYVPVDDEIHLRDLSRTLVMPSSGGGVLFQRGTSS